MKIFVLLLFYVFYNINKAEIFDKHDPDNWFWKKNYSDGSQHDHDPEREFFRDSSTYSEPDISTTTEEAWTTWNTWTPEETTETIIVTTPEETTEMTTNRTPEETTDLTTENEYYKRRKHLALTCKANEQHILEDEFGCQICGCNGEGAILCTKYTCGVSGPPEHSNAEIMKDAVNNNLIMREYATGCKEGTAVQVARGRCTCSCVLPSVLSCPKSCFYSDDVTTVEPTTTTAETYTPGDKE